MHTAAGTLTPHTGAFQKAPAQAKHPQSPENKKHTTGAAAIRGAAVGAVIGIAIFGLLLWLAGISFFAPGYMALYLGGIAMCTIGGSGIAALWHLGAAEENIRPA